MLVGASAQVLTGPSGFWWVSRFWQDVGGLRGSPWVSAGLGGSWGSWQVLGRSRQVLVCLSGSWQVSNGLSGSGWVSAGLI